VPHSSSTNSAEAAERRRHIRGLLLLALAAIAFAILRAAAHGGLHRVFPHGWWRLG